MKLIKDEVRGTKRTIILYDLKGSACSAIFGGWDWSIRDIEYCLSVFRQEAAKVKYVVMK